MALIKRTVKGSPLTFAEGDANLQYLEDLALGRINGEGAQGPQGTTGTQGPQGPRGTQGDVGNQGAQGITGTQGPQGATGVQGSQGATGNQGISGNNGPAGTQGPQGTQGTQGSQGTQGPQGDQIDINWNSNQSITIRNTEQLTLLGDYVLDNVEMLIEGSDVEIEYSLGKYFKKEGSIFIGGNLLVKDSYIENNGKISVGGKVILIGNSQINGTGIII